MSISFLTQLRLLPAAWLKKTLLSFLYFHWLFSLSAPETSSGKRSIFKSTHGKGWSQGLVRQTEAPSDGLLKSWLHSYAVCYRFLSVKLQLNVIDSSRHPGTETNRFNNDLTTQLSNSAVFINDSRLPPGTQSDFFHSFDVVIKWLLEF